MRIWWLAAALVALPLTAEEALATPAAAAREVRAVRVLAVERGDPCGSARLTILGRDHGRWAAEAEVVSWRRAWAGREPLCRAIAQREADGETLLRSNAGTQVAGYPLLSPEMPDILPAVGDRLLLVVPADDRQLASAWDTYIDGPGVANVLASGIARGEAPALAPWPEMRLRARPPRDAGLLAGFETAPAMRVWLAAGTIGVWLMLRAFSAATRRARARHERRDSRV